MTMSDKFNFKAITFEILFKKNNKTPLFHY